MMEPPVFIGGFYMHLIGARREKSRRYYDLGIDL